MKILSILLANTLLASSGASSPGNITNKNVFASTSDQGDSKLLPFVEIGFTLEDYIYFQEEGDFESVVDYIIASKKINIDKILADPSVREKLKALIEQSGLTLQKARTILLEIIASKIASDVHESYKSEVEEITSKSGSSSSSSGSSRTFTPALDKANWLLSSLGTQAIIEWFNSEYGAIASDDKGSGGEAKWEATADFVAKAQSFAKADDARLQTLFNTWKGKGGSTYNARKNAFIGPQPSDVDKTTMWQSNDNASFLAAYNTWRASTDAGKGQLTLKPKWKASTSGAHNYQDAKTAWQSASGQLSDWRADNDAAGGAAKLTAFMNDPAKRGEMLSFWKTDASNDGFDTKADAWLADVNDGVDPKTKKAWYWSNSFRNGVNTWIQALTSASAGVSDDSLIKSAWYFSPNYMTKVQTHLVAGLGNENALDAWLALPKGIEAIRHFAANNPNHDISAKFVDFWKSEAGSNYNFASSQWLNKANKVGDTNNLRAKPSKTDWLNEAHDAWDTYKVWADGEAKTDADAISAVEGSITVPNGAKKTDYKASTEANNDFVLWFDKLTQVQKEEYYVPSYKGSPEYSVDKTLFPLAKDKDEAWGVNNSDLKLRVAEKLAGAPSNSPLWIAFKAYRDEKKPGSTNDAELYIQDFRDNPTGVMGQLFDDLYNDAKSAGPSALKTKAEAFKTSFVEDNVEDNSHVATNYKWKSKWFDLEKTDIDWNNWDSRFYWISDQKVSRDDLFVYINERFSTTGILDLRQKIFHETQFGKTWRLNNSSASDGVWNNRANKGLTDKETWLLQFALNDISTIPGFKKIPDDFTAWKNSFKPLFMKRKAYIEYVAGLSTAAKKDLTKGGSTAWDAYIASADGDKSYKAWRNSQSAFQDEVAKELKKDYDTHKAVYDNSVGDRDYKNWSPWYIKTTNDYDMYVRNALELETTKSPVISSLYLRYMAARYKEADPFYVGAKNSYVQNKHWLYSYGSESNNISDISKMFRHPNLPVNALRADQFKYAGRNSQNEDKAEYRGGFTEKNAYDDNKTDWKDMTSGDQNPVIRDIMTTKQDIFLDIVTRFPEFYLDQATSNPYIVLPYLFSEKWLTEFSDSSLEAYYAFRDKFLDNSNTGRDPVVVFSDSDITRAAKDNLTQAEKETIYRAHNYMETTTAAKVTSRRNDFITWAKDDDNGYSPVLINHYFNSDTLSKATYDQWTPYWLHSKADYEKIFGLDEDYIDVPDPGAGTPAAKRAMSATEKHIALIKFFTIEMAQDSIKGTPSNNLDNGESNGKKFWNTLWNKGQSDKTNYKLWIRKIPLWNSLHKRKDFAGEDAEVEKNFRYEFSTQTFGFNYLLEIVKQMEDANDLDFDSDFVDDASEIKLSEQIIDYDKTKAKQPYADISDFKTNKQDDIWTKVFLAKEANYKTDYEAWVNAQYDKPATHGATFDKWTKIIDNGQFDFLAHGDAAAAMSAWVIPTAKTTSDYDVMDSTWDNLKALWAKETFLSWKINTGHFYHWFNTKKDFNGVVKDDFLVAYRQIPIGIARKDLDVDGTYSKAEESADIIKDFNDKAWWLVHQYISETTVQPTEFSAWSNLYNLPAKRDIILEIDADRLKTEVEAAYKAADADYLGGYKLWRDAIAHNDKLNEYDGLAASTAKHDDYKKNYNGWS